MHNTESPKLKEIFSKGYASQGNAIKFENASQGTQEEEDLKAKVSIMRRQLEFLKTRINTEKDMLQKEKLELYNHTIRGQDGDIDPAQPPNYSARPSTDDLDQMSREFLTSGEPSDDRLSLSPPSKQHLRSIEENCNLELTKLDKYVENIKDLRMYWQFLKSHHRINELGEEQSVRSLGKPKRVHEGVPSIEWLNRNRTFI